MSVPVQIFDWKDPGAPQLVAHNPYTFFAVIRACLIGNNGIAYGKTPSAGWTLYGEDRQRFKLVIQQKGGNQRYLQFSQPKIAQIPYGCYSVSARMYESMTNLDTGIGQDPYFSTNNSGLSDWYIGPITGSAFPNDAGAYNAYNGAVPWTILADDRFFYFKHDPIYSYSSSGSYSFFNSTYFFGDLAGAQPNDSYATVLWAYSIVPNGGTYATPMNSYNAGWYSQSGVSPWAIYSSASGENGNNPNLWIMRPLSQNPQALSTPICQLVYNNTMAQVTAVSAVPGNAGYGAAQPAIQQSYYNKQTTLTPAMIMETNVKPRGMLPGAYYPNTQGWNNWTEGWQFTDNNGIPWYLLQNWQPMNNTTGWIPLRISGGANYVNMFIRTDTWRHSWDTP